MNQLAKKVKETFLDKFGRDGILVQSPGRVNLIGGHTDYNEGFVLPAAVDKVICLAMAANDSNEARFYSVDKNDLFETDISGNLTKTSKGWPDYLLGVIDQLKKHGYAVGGFDCVFSGNVPVGAGMSSSAALEGGTVFGLSTLFDLGINTKKMAQIAQKAENDFVGVQCGIMDQFISLNGKENHVMKLDCRSLEYELHPLKDDDIYFLICDTQVRHELASTSEYNKRRAQCEEGVKVLQEYDDSIHSLRDVSISLLKEHKNELDPIVYKRCEYIVSENTRVLKACKDLGNGDISSFGQRMFEAHAGLRDKYEVSCPELDVLIEEARQIEGVYGARMMGGGFGGCTVNLIEKEAVPFFKKQVAKNYNRKTGIDVKIYQTKVSAGTHLLKNIKSRSVEV